MSKLKSILLMGLSMVLVAALSIGGTLAYLQDEDSAVNVMTLGNVKIEQLEYERNEKGELVPFNQNKPLYPYVGEVAWNDTTININGHDYKMFGEKLKNAVDKIVTVKNTGKTAAYVRTWIAVEDPFDVALIGVNVGGVGYTQSGWTTATIGGVQYSVTSFTYTDALKPGEESLPSLLQVYLKYSATNEDVAKLGEAYEILAFTQAVQAAGFDTAANALTAAFGDTNPWGTGATISYNVGITEGGTYDLTGDVYTIDSAYVHTQKVTEDVTINGNGATINGTATSVDVFQWENGTIPAMSPIFSSADGSKVTVNDLKFTGTMSAIMLGHYQNATYNNYNTEFNNVDVIGTEVVSFSGGVSPAVCVYGTAVLNNCNIYGTTLSKLDTDPMWPVYDVAAVNYTDLTVKNSKIGSLCMWNQAKVTVAAGTEVETIVVRGNMNPTKYGLTVEAGATVGAIDLSAITNKAKINITIEDGATVGKIIANGVEYATITDWLNA